MTLNQINSSKLQFLDLQLSINEISSNSLQEIEYKLHEMLENGKPAMTLEECNQGISTLTNIQKLAVDLSLQIAAATLWKSENKCPQCGHELIQLMDSCMCGWNVSDLHTELTEHSDFWEFLIPLNATE